MAQTTKRESQRKKTESAEKPLISERFQHPAAILVLFLSLIIFFHDAVFDGKVFVSSDSIAAQSFSPLIQDAAKEGTVPLWNPYIFCGMPGVASMSVGVERAYDLSNVVLMRLANVFDIFNKTIGWVLFFYLLFACGIYLFAEYKLHNKMVAVLVALATTYSTYIIIWMMSFHITKITVIAFFPYIFYLVERLREKFSLLLSLLLILCVHCLILPGHVQMIFYVFFALGIYYIYYLVRTIAKKESLAGVLRSAALLTVATCFAFLMSADQYLSTLEYAKYSMRGADPIQNQLQSGTQDEKKGSGGGLDYDYATSWSFSPRELLTFIVPSAYGFGDFNYQGPLTNNENVRLMTYFGPQPFTSAPRYMGIVVLALAFVGIAKYRKDPFVQYLISLTVIALLISFGKEVPILYDLMFKYFPFFNKFRGPDQIQVLVELAIPLLAGFGAVGLLSSQERQPSSLEDKKWKRFVGLLGAIAVLTLVARPAVESIYSSFFPQQDVMAVLGRQYQQNVQSAIYGIITAEAAADVTAAFILLTITFGAFWLYRKGTIRLELLGIVLAVCVLTDLWRVDAKTMDPQDARQAQSEVFGTSDYVKFLMQDTTAYRTLEFTNGQPPYSNTLAYFRIQSAYGYQGAKMRAYQDVVDNVGLANPLLWGLMNVRYIISNRPDSSAILQPVFQGHDRIVYRNRAELPRAFFVDKYEIASGLQILGKMRDYSFQPRQIAYMLDDPKIAVDPPLPEAHAQYSKFDINHFELSVNATGKNLLFLSEAYYPEGWKAYIDGAETPIYRLDYLFRGVIVPIGQHTLSMVFKPQGYFLGKTISLTINILVLGCILVTGGIVINKRKKSLKAAQSV